MTTALAKLLTMPQTRALIAKLMLPPHAHPTFVWAWSRWRRDHQATAAISHRRTRNNTQL